MEVEKVEMPQWILLANLGYPGYELLDIDLEGDKTVLTIAREGDKE